MEVPSVGQNCSGLPIAAGPRFCPTATGDNRTGVGYTTRKARAHVASFVRRGCDGHSKSSSTNFTYIGVFHAGDRLADLSRLLPAGGRWCDRVTRQDISRGRGTPQWGWPARRGRRGRGARWIEHDLLRPEVGERASSRSTNGVPPPTPPGGQNSSLRFVDSMRNSPGSPRRTRAGAACQRSWSPSRNPGAVRALRARPDRVRCHGADGPSARSRASNARSLAAWSTGGRCSGARSQRRVRSSGTSSSTGSCSSPAQRLASTSSPDGVVQTARCGHRSSLVMVTPAGFEPAISTLKGSRPGPG